MKGRRGQDPTPVEMLLAKVTDTETGYPADLRTVEALYGGRVARSTKGPDWFWIGATERAADDIRRRGLHVIGERTTTYIPADEHGEVLVYGSPEWVEQMLEETLDFDGPDAKGAGGYYYADAPEAPGHPSGNEFAGGPLRKVIVFRLREVQPS